MKLKLPPKKYCTWEYNGEDVGLIQSSDGSFYILYPYTDYHCGSIHITINDPNIVYRIGEFLWEKEVERLDKWLQVWIKYHERYWSHKRKEIKANKKHAAALTKKIIADIQRKAWKNEVNKYYEGK